VTLTVEKPLPLQKQKPNFAVEASKSGESLLTSAALLQASAF